MSILLFSIDNEAFPSLNVMRWKYFGDIQDGSGTGRTEAAGQPLFRDPAGTFKNIEMEIAQPQSDNPEFMRLLDILDSFGLVPFRSVKLLMPWGHITQQMYSSSYSMEANAIREYDVEIVQYFSPLRIKFIAERAYLIP